MITKSGRHVIFTATLIMVIVIASVAVAMLMEFARVREGDDFFSKTADAIYKTNTQVSIFNMQTRQGDGWTKTPTKTFTPTPSRQ